MCFSAPASFIAGAALSATGIVTLKQVKKKKEIPLALIPLLFGIQQLIEGFVWISLGWGMPKFNMIASYGFIFFSHILWPTFVPMAMFAIEPIAWRKKVMLTCAAFGIVASTYALLEVIVFPVSSQVTCNSIQYLLGSLHLPFFIHAILYLVATCIAPLFSSHRLIRFFGIVVIIALAISYYFYTVTFASVWCFFAALLSVIIYFSLKK